MWNKKITVEEACELREKAIDTVVCGEHRWTYTIEFIVPYKESPSGYVGFMLDEPRSFEELGIMDVNCGDIGLYPVESKEVTKTVWQPIGGHRVIKE